jgi:uncharacterized protein YqfB (UPF0267 family)
MVVKTNLDGDIRRFAHQDSRTLDQLKRLIQTSYGLEEEAFALRYTDGVKHPLQLDFTVMYS